MAEKLKIVICDDEPQEFEDTKDAIGALVSDEIYERPLLIEKGRKIPEAINVLLGRRNTLVDEKKPFEYTDCFFDDVDVLILDYDLIHIDTKGARWTGEGLARLVRSFSKCGLIIVVNQFLDGDFDLGMRGHIDSFADMNMSDNLLKEAGLWQSPPWKGFRPWSWCEIPQTVDQLNQNVEFLLGGAMDAPILPLLGLGANDALRLSDRAAGFLNTKAKTAKELLDTTFTQFLQNGERVGIRSDVDAILELQPEAAARLAAARIMKWISRELIGAQDILVDIPHLVERCPFVLGAQADKPEAWKKALVDPSIIDNKLVPDHVHLSKAWSTKCAVIWSKLETSPDFKAARRGFNALDMPELVFMEDTSSFGSPDEAHEFRADFQNVYDRRYVKKIDGYRYLPQRRLAFGE